MPSCTCGAKGDRGEMVAHMATVLADPDDTRTHKWQGGPEPEQVAAERAARQAREATLRKLAAAAGVGVDELREALR
ncbi:MAG UNVERIFIED_CONTAM: hypothetical protein LOD86_10935 [Thermobifida fusca]